GCAAILSHRPSTIVLLPPAGVPLAVAAVSFRIPPSSFTKTMARDGGERESGGDALNTGGEMNAGGKSTATVGR
ncbi:hypothetical protein A2U01_0011432, partial [Trifolium medium]|nr:hypothetical protein [Trifolium medium]